MRVVRSITSRVDWLALEETCIVTKRDRFNAHCTSHDLLGANILIRFLLSEHYTKYFSSCRSECAVDNGLEYCVLHADYLMFSNLSFSSAAIAAALGVSDFVFIQSLADDWKNFDVLREPIGLAIFFGCTVAHERLCVRNNVHFIPLAINRLFVITYCVFAYLQFSVNGAKSTSGNFFDDFDPFLISSNISSGMDNNAQAHDVNGFSSQFDELMQDAPRSDSDFHLPPAHDVSIAFKAYTINACTLVKLYVNCM